MALLSPLFAAASVLGLFTIAPQDVLGWAWVAAAVTALATAVIVKRTAARLCFGVAALLTGYLAWLALGPRGDEEFVYPFAVLRWFAVVGAVYAFSFTALLVKRGSDPRA